MTTITIESMCSGLGHWQVSVGEVVFPVDWADLQTPLDPEETVQMARLVLRAKSAGVPLHELGDLLLNGVAL